MTLASRDQQRDWLTLLRTPQVGPVGLKRALAHAGGDLHRLLNAGDHAWRAAGLAAPARAWLRQPDNERLDADQAWLSELGHHLITRESHYYPPRLAQLDNAPPALLVVGDPEVLSAHQLAVVGSRNPTPPGLASSREFAACLAARGLVITSGLALGVDGAAHAGALDSGGLSVAACATGPDRVYPARHRHLARRISEHGAMVSEFPLGTPPLARNFPRRNRIISGLSLGVLVIEAAQRSGSLITARLAMEQGREVFAMPGSIHNPLARGCHRLIREGAKLVETAGDILEELAPLIDLAGDAAPVTDPHKPAEPVDELDSDYQQLIEKMGFDATRVDDLVARTQLTPGAVSSMLLRLELKGIIAQASDGTYSRLG